MTYRGRDAADDIRVLLVDDYPEYVTAGQEYLESVDDEFTVLPETSAESALSRLSRTTVDCVVCDYEMPDMDGTELLGAIRSESPELPVVLLTGHDLKDLDEEITEEATDVLQKGSGTHTFEQLRSRVRDLTDTEVGFQFNNVTG